MYIDDRLRRNVSRNYLPNLEQWLADFEQTIGAPIRMMSPGDQRQYTTYTRGWTGRSSSMEHYAGFTEEDRDRRGVTILAYSHHANRIGFGNWYIPDDFMESCRPGYEDYGEADRLVQDISQIDQSAVEAGGGRLLTFTGREGTVAYGELYEGRVMFIHGPFHYVFGYGMPNLQEWIGNPIIECLDPELAEEMQARRRERERELFVRMMHDQGNYAITSIREQLDQVQQEVGQAQEILVNRRATGRQLQRQLDILLDSEGSVTDEQIEKEWQAIINHAKVESVQLGSNQLRSEDTGETVDNTFIELITTDLMITNPRNRRTMPLGRFRIVLNFGANTIRITNLTMRMGPYRDHPHIQEGQLCAGDFGTAVVTLLRQRKLADMVSMVFHILATVTPEDDWGRNIVNWEDADDQRRRDNGWPAWTPEETEYPSDEPVTDNPLTDEDLGYEDESEEEDW